MATKPKKGKKKQGTHEVPAFSRSWVRSMKTPEPEDSTDSTTIPRRHIDNPGGKGTRFDHCGGIHRYVSRCYKKKEREQIMNRNGNGTGTKRESQTERNPERIHTTRASHARSVASRFESAPETQAHVPAAPLRGRPPFHRRPGHRSSGVWVLHCTLARTQHTYTGG